MGCKKGCRKGCKKYRKTIPEVVPGATLNEAIDTVGVVLHDAAQFAANPVRILNSGELS